MGYSDITDNRNEVKFATSFRIEGKENQYSKGEIMDYLGKK